MPRTSRNINNDPGFLVAALEGLEMQKQRLEDQIEEVKSLLGRSNGPAQVPSKRASKRVLSASARKRIAAAQKKRWAEFRKKTPAVQG